NRRTAEPNRDRLPGSFRYRLSRKSQYASGSSLLCRHHSISLTSTLRLASSGVMARRPLLPSVSGPKGVRLRIKEAVSEGDRFRNKKTFPPSGQKVADNPPPVRRALLALFEKIFQPFAPARMAKLAQ